AHPPASVARNPAGAPRRAASEADRAHACRGGNPDAPRRARVAARRRRHGDPNLMHIPLTLSGAIGFWLGIQTLRLFFAMVVWNVAEDQLPTIVGLVALAVWSVGLLGWIVARIAGGTRPV